MFEWLTLLGTDLAVLFQILAVVFSVPITIAIGLLGSIASIATLFAWLHGMM
jgi:hypothetical protein